MASSGGSCSSYIDVLHARITEWQNMVYTQTQCVLGDAVLESLPGYLLSVRISRLNQKTTSLCRNTPQALSLHSVAMYCEKKHLTNEPTWHVWYGLVWPTTLACGPIIWRWTGPGCRPSDRVRVWQYVETQIEYINDS
jgi:hypothetical protein